MDKAVDRTLESMPDTFNIKPFLLGNRAEVKDIMITEYNEEEEMAKLRKEYYGWARRRP